MVTDCHAPRSCILCQTVTFWVEARIQAEAEHGNVARFSAAFLATENSDAADVIVIGMFDMYFEPERIRIPAKTDVRLIFENRGAAPHNFEIKDLDISVDVAPGETGEVVINLPAKTYKFICNVPGHRQVGMNGALVVR